ncbi:HSFY1 protein, partial [Penelope pileata]|nr:HSFY1 protein [Penelope pileata]
QSSSDKPCTKRVCLNPSEERTCKTEDLSFCSFLKKLWEICRSDQFQSIWWGDDGNCVVIEGNTFRKEVLARRGPLQIFKTNSMKTFIHQLRLHGFCQTEGNSASLGESQEEASARSPFGKLLSYRNAYFKRDYPHLLRGCEQSAGVKKRAPAALSLDLDLKEGSSRRTP